MHSSYKLVFYTGIPHSGVTFLFSVLEKNPYISTVMLSDEFFAYLASQNMLEPTRKNGVGVYYDMIDKLSVHPDTMCSVDTIAQVVKKIGPFICKSEKFLNHFSMLTKNEKCVSIKDAISFVFKAKMLSSGKTIDEKHTPVFFFDAHCGFNSIIKHQRIIEVLDDVCFLTSFRNPLYTTASSIKKGYYSNKAVMYNLLKSNFFGFAQNLPTEWKEKYYVVLFEEEKLNPEQTFRAVCNTFQIPYDDIMLTANEGGPTSRGYAIYGFDIEPVTRKLDDIFSDQDISYLNDLFQKVMCNYGYIDSSCVSQTRFDENDLFNIVYQKKLVGYDKKDFWESLHKLENYASGLADDHFFPKKIYAGNSL